MVAHVGPSLTGCLADSLLSSIARRAAALSELFWHWGIRESAGLLLLVLRRFLAVRSINSSPLLLSNSSTSSSLSAMGGQCFQRPLRAVFFAGGG